MKIAVTGGFGSGKSSVSKILAQMLKAELVDTDQLCREQMQPGQKGFMEFQQTFGLQYINADGSLNKLLLRHAVFSNEFVKEKLEGILHPLVRTHVHNHYAQCSSLGVSMVVEVPLLFETGWQKDFDICLVVNVSPKISLKRVKKRDGLSLEEIQLVVASQMPMTQKLDLAHFVVDNNGTFVSTVHQIAWFSKKLSTEKIDGNLLFLPAKKLDSASVNTYKEAMI